MRLLRRAFVTSESTRQHVGKRLRLGIILAVVVVASACGSGTTSRGSTTSPSALPPAVAPSHGSLAVDLFGDSLAAQAAPDFDRIIEAKGGTVTNHVFGGTAVCDWIPAMHDAAAKRPQAAVLVFSGNTLTSCMAGCRPESPKSVNKYCADVDTTIHIFLAVGARVFLIGTPISYAQWIEQDPHRNDLNRAYAALAAKYPGAVRFVDAGLAVDGPGGAFTWNLACLPTEPCDGPVVAGVRTNMVRAPDGAHLCASVAGLTLGCPSYSSGAFRFASAMAEPMLKAFQR